MSDRYVLEVFPLGPLQCNCTILINESQKKAVVVDPGMGASQIIARLSASPELEITRIWLTHAHLDHIAGVQEVKMWASAQRGADVPVHLHAADEPLYRNAKAQCEMWGVPPFEVPETYIKIKTADTYPELPGARVLYTPGHSPGSCSLYLDAPFRLDGNTSLFRGVESEGQGFLIAGDVLFRGSVGRTDLWQGSMEQLENSIKKQVYTLPDETLVVVGHGPLTTVGREADHNQVVTRD
ncbi:MAG TPA: MBL fold metallo-hydrolase [Bdellovibrionota bacterium]|jgi:glyoxylase-like metal-dependent hydrolase (beta-lactamase superfamily II)|nr:MBL fold metallo-hydrolase [Bdellovibrionota bacterium]